MVQNLKIVKKLRHQLWNVYSNHGNQGISENLAWFCGICGNKIQNESFKMALNVTLMSLQP